MTGRQKRYWQILATFLLGGAVAGVAYNVVRVHLAPINFATGAIFGLMIASGIGAFEALVSQGPARLWLRSLPLGGAVAVRSLVYAAVIFPIQYYDLGVKVMGLQSIETPKELWSATAYSIGVSVVFSLLLEISYLIGPRRLIRLIAGLYHAPREEERFVLFVDVAGSTGTAERLGDRRSHTMLNRVFSVATGPVLDFGGEIDQYVGDEMIVTWPAASGVSYGGTVQHTYTISGLVDGLKFNPVTGMVWALQNNDANATLSIINPTTQTVSGPLRYGPPYTYTTPGPLARGYDDVAFLGGKVYLSYTNPVSPTDPVLQILNSGNSPSGTLTTTSILTAAQTGISVPDIDSLKSTPNGELVLTSEGDGAGTGNPVGAFTLIANPGAAKQTVTNVPVTDSMGHPSEGMDDVLFPGVTQGTLFVTDTPTNKVYEVRLTGLDPNTPIISLGNFGEVATVNPVTGVVETPVLTGLSAPHGLDFIPFAVPEPSSWAMMLLGFGGLGFLGFGQTRKAKLGAV